MDRFPEAFRRFEEDVDISDVERYNELRLLFSHWGGKRWRDSYRQNLALARIAEKRGFEDVTMPAYFRTPFRWTRTIISGRHRRLSDRQISIIRKGIRENKSSNQIIRQLKRQGLGRRRQVLLKQIREMK